MTARVAPAVVLAGILFAALSAPSAAQLIDTDSSGKLIYGTDPDGNRITDFSYAGYRGGGVAIPNIPTALTLAPSGGDDTHRIQRAIDQLASRPLGADGFRGALLLKKGKYTVSDTLHIRDNGVVIRGEGAGFGGTWIYHQPPDQFDDTAVDYAHFPQPEKGILPTFQTHGGGVNTQKLADITDALVPAGFDRVNVSDASSFSPGMEVVVKSQQTRQWVDDLGLNDHWNAEDFQLEFPRVVKEVDHAKHEVVFNVPVTSRIDQAGGYADAELHRVVSDNRVKNVGFEDMLFVSGYDRTEKDDGGHYNDENHANYAFRFYDARDGWARRIVGMYYSGGVVSTSDSQHLTVEDAAMIDGVSEDTPSTHRGAREYYFNAQGDQLLFQRLYARGARHAFIGNGTNDGGVFLDSVSEDDHLKSEWHQKWGHGHLFDNLSVEAQIGLAGTLHGHGQKAAFSLAWNNLINNQRDFEPDLFVNKFDNLVQNYAIGNVITGSGEVGTTRSFGELGIIEALNDPQAPRSLYLTQLRERLGDSAVQAIAHELQLSGKRGAMWEALQQDFKSLPQFMDPAAAPWQGLENWIAFSYLRDQLSSLSIDDQVFLKVEDFEGMKLGGPQDTPVSNPLAAQGWFNGALDDDRLGAVRSGGIDGRYHEAPASGQQEGGNVDHFQQMSFEVPDELDQTTNSVFYSFALQPRSWHNTGRLRLAVSPASSPDAPLGGSPGNFGVRFGLSDGLLEIREAPFGQSVTALSPIQINEDDWIEILLLIDQDPDDVTLSTGSLFVRNLSLGQDSFDAVPGLQDIPLGFSESLNAGTINTFVLDDVRFKVGIDNLAVGIIPEPGSFSLLALGMLALCRRHR